MPAPTPPKQELGKTKGRIKTGTWWATVRGAKALPSLWESRESARANCDPDEYVVQVRVEAVNLRNRLWKWSRAAR